MESSFLEEIYTLQQDVVLATAVSNNLSAEETDLLVAEFLVARAHLAYIVELKLGCWGSLPHALSVLGHHDIAVARRGLQQALDLFQAMCSEKGRLWKDVQEFLASGTISLELHKERGKFKIIQVAERSVERLHRITKFVVEKAPNHTPPMLSLALRLREIESHLDIKPAHLLQFASRAVSIQNPADLAKAGCILSSNTAVLGVGCHCLRCRERDRRKPQVPR